MTNQPETADRPFADEPTDVLRAALGLATRHAEQAARFRPAQPDDALPAVVGLLRAELQHREGTLLPPPEGPEYTPCSSCTHIGPEHQPDAGPCLVCDCRAYEPAAVSAVVEPPADQTTPSHRAGLRDRITTAISKWHRDPEQPLYEQGADAVLAVLYREWPWLRAEAEDAKPADRAAVLREAADQLDQYVGLQSSDAAPEVEGARLVIRELRRIAERSQPAVEPGTCGHRSPEGRLCNRAAGHLGYHRRTQPDSDGWTSWVADLPGEAQAVLRRMADETATDEPQPESCAHCGQPIRRVTGTLAAWWVHDPGGNTVCDPQHAASSTRATPERVKHSGPDTKFCVLCLSGEHERVDEPAAGARQDGGRP